MSAKLIYKYGTMGSGKSMELIKTKYNYDIQGKHCVVLTSSLDTRSGLNEVKSRNGQTTAANYITDNTFDEILNLHVNDPINCILVDESQFLSEDDVFTLSEIVDNFDIPVICFGLKTDFVTGLFTGSDALLRYADEVQEMVTECFNCSRKSILNLRLVNGLAVYTGEQIEIGDSEYLPVCRYCYKHFNEIKGRNVAEYKPSNIFEDFDAD